MKIPKKIKGMPWPEPWEPDGLQKIRITLNWPVENGERLLCATIQEKNGSTYRLAASKKQHRCRILSRDGKPHRKSICQMFRSLVVSSYPEISEADEKALGKWLGETDSQNHFLPELNRWTEDALKEELQAERDARGELRDEEWTLCPEELPAGLVEWICREVLPEDDVLVYDRGNIRGRCFICGERVTARYGQRFRQGEYTYCPNCGAHVACVLNGGQSFQADYVQNIAALQAGTDGRTVFIRQWHLCRDMSGRWEHIDKQLEEIGRYAMRGNRCAKWTHEAKETWMYNSYRYRTAGWERSRKMSEVYDGVYYFYAGCWEEALNSGPLQYCPLGEYMEQKSRKTMNQIRFLMDWARYPAVEKLWKAGYRRLVNQKTAGYMSKEDACAVKWNRNSITEAMQLPRSLLKRFTPEEWDGGMVRKMQGYYGLVQKGMLHERDIELLWSKEVNPKYIEPALQYAGAGKIVRWLEKGPGIAAQNDYRDYLQECRELELDLKDMEVLLPKDLRAAHARTTAQVRYKHDQQAVEQFKKAVGKLERMSWNSGGLLIRPARTPQELTEEGSYLHHCVGGYVQRMSNGETAIFLIRKKEDPDTPFYTLEWRDGTVVQCRTLNNQSYVHEPEVKAFVEGWQKHMKKKGRKAA